MKTSMIIKKTILFILTIGLFISFVTSIIGCSANYHLKQSKRHLEKAKAKGYIPLADTVYKLDTVTLLGVRTDTIFEDVGDTITLTKERLKVIYRRDTITNRVYISGECEADTVIKEIPVSVQETVYIEQSPLEWAGINKWWEKALFWLAIVLVSVILALLFLRKVIG